MCVYEGRAGEDFKKKELQTMSKDDLLGGNGTDPLLPPLDGVVNGAPDLSSSDQAQNPTVAHENRFGVGAPLPNLPVSPHEALHTIYDRG